MPDLTHKGTRPIIIQSKRQRFYHRCGESEMNQKIYHGNISPNDVARVLISEFNRGNLEAQQLGQGNQVIVQIATSRRRRAGGDTALSVTLQRHKDGVAVMVGQQFAILLIYLEGSVQLPRTLRACSLPTGSGR
jgi:hypothetical protein